MDNKPKYLIVAGASAGGINALTELIAQLDEDIDAAICVVIHLSKTGGSVAGFLAHRMQQYTSMRCVVAQDSMPIVRGSIYIAPADSHLVVSGQSLICSRNNFRIQCSTLRCTSQELI